jgi:hypothetical protein
MKYGISPPENDFAKALIDNVGPPLQTLRFGEEAVFMVGVGQGGCRSMKGAAAQAADM